MPFPRPTLTKLRLDIAQDIASSGLPGADGFMRRAALPILGKIQAGQSHEHYGYLDNIALQATPFTATGEYLEAWAALAPTPVLRQAPVAASGAVQFSGVATTDMPINTAVIVAGASYATTADAVVSGLGVVTAPIAAVIPGSAGNAPLGAVATLSNPIAGINSTGTVSTIIAGGADLETDTSLRTRMFESYATPPAGGAQGDYVTWALAVSGVTRAWCYRNGMGPGTVVVYFMMDVAEASHNGFPQGSNGVATSETRATAGTGDQLAVANALYPLQPVTALVYAAAPTPQTQAFTLTGLTSATTAQKAQVSAALTQLLVQMGNPLGTVGIEQSDVDAAILAIPGLPTFAVMSPSSWPITPAVGSLLTLGTVTYA